MIRPKFFFTFPSFLLACIVAFLLSGCTSTGYNSSSSKIAPDPSILRIGVSANSPPLVYKKNDTITGLEADFGRKLAKFTGKKAKFVEVKWRNMIDALENNEIDIIMSSMSITSGREYRIAFSNPYLRSGQILLVRLEERARFTTGIYSLMNSNYTIGIIKDTTGDLFITRTINGAKTKSFTKSADAVKALIDKKIDVFVYDAPMVCHYAAVNENAKLTPILNLATEEYLAWGIRKEDNELLNQANQFLQELKETEQLQQMIRTWIPYM
jgi:polar amino acid transport system substrate-binding protein